jgi:DNA-directed RNA polymerase subunit RPC12/RpoP
MADVIEKQGKGIKPVKREKLIRDVEDYLASVGCFVIYFKVGHGFVEAQTIDEIMRYMRTLNRSYICEKCGKDAVAHDDKNHEGDKCEICGGKMKIVNPIDVEKNRKRIQRLMDKYPGGKK